MYRVLLAEEQPAIRHALRTVLDQQNYEVVREVQDGLEALWGTLELNPDLLILALRLKRLGGLEVIRRLRRKRSKVKILVLTAADSEHFVELCLQAGATGFLSKQEDLSELSVALQAIVQGHTFFPSHTAENFEPRHAGERSESEQMQNLSPREVTVLNYLTSGYTNKAIASEMSLSDRTVSTYKLRLFRKLNIRSLIELAEVARRHNVLGPGMLGDESPSPVQTLERRENDLFQRAVDAMPIGISIRDRQGRLVFANDFLIAAYQRKRDELLGSTLADLEQFDPRDAAEVESIYREAVTLGIPFHRELTVTFKGTARIQSFWGVPIHDARGETTLMVCGSRNIADQEAAFQLLRDEKARADATSYARAAILAEHARASAGPLDSLEKALAQLQTDRSLAPASGEALTRALSAARAIRLEQETLQTLITLEGAVPATVARPCDLVLFVGKVAESLGERYRETGPDVTLEASDARGSVVWLDEDWYRQIVTGLIAHLAVSLDCSRVALALHSKDKPRALVAVELEIRYSRIGKSSPLSQKPEEVPGMQTARNLAESLKARLIVGEQTRSGVRLRLQFVVPKAAADLLD